MTGGIILTEEEKKVVMLGIERLKVETKKLAAKAETMSSKYVTDEIKAHWTWLEDLKSKFL